MTIHNQPEHDGFYVMALGDSWCSICCGVPAGPCFRRDTAA